MVWSRPSRIAATSWPATCADALRVVTVVTGPSGSCSVDAIGLRTLSVAGLALHPIATGRLDNVLARRALTEPRRGALLKRNRESMNRGWDVLRTWVEATDGLVSVQEPEATGLAFVRYHLDLSSVEVGHAIREGASVLVCPGVFFGIEGNLRINFGFGVEYVHDALAATTPVLRALEAG